MGVGQYAGNPKEFGEKEIFCMEGLDKWKSGGFSDMERENVAAIEYLSKKVQEP